MVQALSLYVDDSGSRFPDKRRGGGGHNPSQWFGLGGILLKESDEARVVERYEEFRERWREHLHADAPLHSSDIRQRKGPFAWLTKDAAVRDRFHDDLSALVTSLPILCTACVIDRGGYAARYYKIYDETKRWWLCKTALAVLLERTVKYALREGCVVRVYVERSDKEIDRCMRSYYDDLRTKGLPFDQNSMASYAPLDASALAKTLYDFKTKTKRSRIMQLADLCLYPLCTAGYNKNSRPYQSLVESQKLIDCVLSAEEVRTMGIKYSCFDGQQLARTK
jgi:hypothetical protein